jgi:superfamily II DNA or RNA helicase
MSTTEKGTIYENFVCDHINKNILNTTAYLWKDVPDTILYNCNFIDNFDKCREQRDECKNRLHDIGVDIIQINNLTNEYTFVQCKNHDNVLQMCDLSGYFCIMAQPKHYNKKGAIYVSNDRISANLLMVCDKEKHPFIHLPIENIAEIKLNQIYIPRDYQLECQDKFDNYYLNNNNAIMTMPCGTGKTYTSYLISQNYKIVIILSPLKQHAEQNLSNFKKYSDNLNIKYLIVDSDGVRNLKYIIEKIEKYKEIVIGATYKSCDIIKDIIKTYKEAFIIIDEFHNMSYNNIYNKDDHMNMVIKSENKKLYMSATPRIYELEDEKDCDIEEVLGKIAYKMDFKYAIDNNIICNYDIYLPINDKKNYDELIEVVELKKYDKSLAQKVCYYYECIKMFGNLKTILYFQTHEHIDEFIECFNDANKYYNYKYHIDKIICTNTQKDRNKKIEKFQNYDGISILCSVGILDECIDIPECDSVYITYECKSKITIVQRISRALRKKGNKTAKILVWCKNIGEIKKLVSAIKEIDENIANKIKYVSYGKNFIKDIERNQEQKIYVHKYNGEIKNIKKYDIEFKNEVNHILNKNDNHIINLLKKNTAIDSDFIDKYCKFYDLCKTQIFGINIEDVIKYLNIKKSEEFYRRLRDNFKENVHYIIKINNRSKKEGNKVVEYFISMKTFMNICMKSNAEKSKKVRDYFTELYKFIDYHENDISD